MAIEGRYGPYQLLSTLKDNRAIFQIPLKSKSINSYETQLKCTLIYGLSINERGNPVSFMFYGI